MRAARRRRRARCATCPNAVVEHRPQLGLARARAPAGALRPRGGRLPRARGGALPGAGFYRRLARATRRARGARRASRAAASRSRRRAVARRSAARRAPAPSSGSPARPSRGRRRRPRRSCSRRRPGAAGARARARRRARPARRPPRRRPGVWLPERPLPAPLRRTSPNAGEATPASVVAGRSLQLHDEVGELAGARAGGGARRPGRRARPRAAPSGSRNVRRPAAIARHAARRPRPGSTIPSRSRPRRFSRT